MFTIWDIRSLCSILSLVKEWLAQIETKRWHFDAAAQFRKSMDDIETNMYGHELARLQQALSSAKKGYDIARRNRVATSVLNDVKVPFPRIISLIIS